MKKMQETLNMNIDDAFWKIQLRSQYHYSNYEDVYDLLTKHLGVKGY